MQLNVNPLILINMSQTIQVNPVELATYLAASQLDTLYQTSVIFYPYVDSDDDDTPSTYTPEGQKEFDKLYDWYYGVVTSHKRKTFLTENVDYEIIKDENVYRDINDIHEILGEVDDSKLIELYYWTEGIGNGYSVYEYEDKYILRHVFANDYGYYDESFYLIKLINP